MNAIGVVGMVLIALNVLLSYKGFKAHSFLEKYRFEIDAILVDKEYYRLVSSGFLHVDWMHLLFNMITLYFFSSTLEYGVGILNFIIVYFASLIGGNLFALFIHRNHGSYAAVGASGAVCGVIFACLALFPDFGVSIFGILPLPGWLYGILFVAMSVYGIKSQRDNIGHEAHLGGALLGLLTAIAFRPQVLPQNYVTILVVFVPCAVFIYLIATRPHLLYVNTTFLPGRKKPFSVDHGYNERKVNEQQELDRILDKISRKGLSSLSWKEKETLDKHSK